MTVRLSRRALNRATLDRQLLLRRATMPVVDAVEHLVGLQAQTPHTWYLGLGSRLAGITPLDVAALLADRSLVRVALHRSTIHLVSARDCQALRPLLQPVIVRATDGAYRRRLGGADADEIAEAGRALVDSGPLTFAELHSGLAGRWPELGQDTIAQTVRARVALVQVPPRGTWGPVGPVSGPIAHTSAATWLGNASAPATVDELVTRYLGAFGPATVKDAQTWSGLTRLREVFARLRPELLVVQDEDGRELFDLPAAPRPDPEVPAPARFLYDFDNLHLSYAERTRFMTPEAVAAKADLNVKNGQLPGTVLLDGEVRAHWTLTRAKGAATVTVRPLAAWSAGDTAAVEAEGAEVLAFLAGDLAQHDVQVVTG